MNRRDTLWALLALAATAKPAASFAQSHPGKSVRVGMIFVSEGLASLFRLFPEALGELGWVEGKNLVIDRRTGDGRPTELPALVAELLRQNPDVIVAPSNFEVEAVLSATRTIPVVVVGAGDPVELGWAQSLAHPGGSVTGFVWADPRTASKLIQITRECVPTTRRLAVLWDERYPGIQSYLAAYQSGADAIQLELRWFPVRRPEDIAEALTSMENARVDGIVMLPNGAIAAGIARILTHAMDRRLPTAFPIPWPVERGGLLSYAPNIASGLRGVAGFVDKILRGAKPADIPFEYPTRYELTINLKTAKALGIKLPQAVLLRADRLIE
jgi:putative ABC transport system substrate-binding protein